MTKTQELLELAERVEKGTGPERALDQQIELALPGRLPHPDTQLPGYVVDEWAYVISGEGHPDYCLGQGYSSSPYTASIDAAMTLVPEGYDWIIGCTNGGLTIHAEVGGRGDEFQRFGNTPALALCAASLRARCELS